MLKKTVLICLIVLGAFACSSDCLECHPKLKPLEYDKKNRYYKQHHFLITCTKCHPNHNDNVSECGADCFECHSRQKLINTPIPQHQKLKSCSKCHNDTVNEILQKRPDFLN